MFVLAFDGQYRFHLHVHCPCHITNVSRPSLWVCGPKFKMKTSDDNIMKPVEWIGETPKKEIDVLPLLPLLLSRLKYSTNTPNFLYILSQTVFYTRYIC